MDILIISIFLINSNQIAVNRNCIYTCANNLITKIKFEYNEEAN